MRSVQSLELFWVFSKTSECWHSYVLSQMLVEKNGLKGSGNAFPRARIFLLPLSVLYIRGQPKISVGKSSLTTRGKKNRHFCSWMRGHIPCSLTPALISFFLRQEKEKEKQWRLFTPEGSITSCDFANCLVSCCLWYLFVRGNDEFCVW